MTIRLRPRHVRSRLTLWYVGVLAGVLAVYACLTLLLLYFSLSRELESKLRAEYEEVEDHVRSQPDGTIRMVGYGEDDERPSRVEVWSTGGALLYRSERLGTETLGETPAVPTDGSYLTSLTLHDGTSLRVRTGVEHVSGRAVIVRVGLSRASLRHDWRRAGLVLFLGLPVAVTIAGVGGHWLAWRALAPLDRMARQAERLTADNLGERLAVENPEDELGHLARVFNLSLSRIEDSFTQLRRFTADASHELRTPLTAIRAVGEVALQAPGDVARYREAIGSMLEEVDRLSRLVDSLLTLSRANAGAVVRREEVNLLDSVQGAATLLEILAEEKGQRIETRGDGDIHLRADPLLLRQAFINLIDNAIKYSPRNAGVRISVGYEPDGDVVVAVKDKGQGIPKADLSHVLERFYRVDSARSREQGGAGLGLSIAAWAIESHGGRIEVQSEEGLGSTFRVVLPRSAVVTRRESA